MFRTQQNHSGKVDAQVLRRLISPGQLSFEKFYELANDAVLEDFDTGASLCKAGGSDGRLLYVLKGDVEITHPNGRREIVRGGEARAKHALCEQQPAPFTAICRTPAAIAKFDFSRFEMLCSPMGTGIDVLNLDDHESLDDTWMTRILQSPKFSYVSPANLQSIFMCLEERPVSAGHVIINQGDEADFYYIVKRGTCSVLRANTAGAKVQLDKLHAGDVFGEEALLTGSVRNASVIMDSDGTVLRLAGKDFTKLLANPLLNTIGLGDAVATLPDDNTVFIDVRAKNSDNLGAIEEANHIPLYLLRLAIETMDRTKKYVCFCDDGSLSTAATFLLGSAGFETYLLAGGLNAQREAC